MTTTHGGYTLLLGNNPQYYDFLRRWWLESATWDAKDVYASWRAQHTLIETPVGAAADEVAADRWAYHQAWSSIQHDPAGFLFASIHRLALFGDGCPCKPRPRRPNRDTHCALRSVCGTR